MAAYAALVSLSNDLELIPNHPTHSFSFDNTQITSLSQVVHSLIDFMETYDPHGCSSRPAIELLESRITSAAQGAHDVVESHVVDQIHAGSTRGGKVRSYFLLDLQRTIDNMEFVKRKAMQFQAKSGSKAEEQPTYSARASSSEAFPKNAMVGFDDIALRLVEMLTGGPSSERSVIPIVGMGGMGKTTLAKHVYEHLFSVHHFDVRLWATISQQYSIEKILGELLFGQGGSDGNVCELGENLHKTLWGRRYLIVLDDMWSGGAWDELQMYFPDNCNGSRVIVTTRLSNLAACLGSFPFEMNFLDEDKSWELFCVKTFGGEDCPLELEETGKKIVKRCRGLPLSVVVIGGHLRRSSRAIEYWEKLSNSINPIASLGTSDQCLEILRLSYEHLPSCLKPCFLYMGVCPEDDWILASVLIQYWVGEGFVKAKNGLSLEEVAEDSLEDLVDRNLILVRTRMWNGKLESFAIHDIVRELCLEVASKESFVCVLSKEGIGCRERRIVLPEGRFSSNTVGALRSAPLARSLIRLAEKSFFDELWVDFRLLRVSAHVNNKFLKTLGFPGANFQQVNLRYLAFFFEKPPSTSRFIPRLPSSLSLFWNMQTLIIKGNYLVQISAPYEIWEMPQLRHLQILRVCLPELLPSDTDVYVLQNLRTLFRVENLRLTGEVCKRMPNLKVLWLWYTHFPDDCETTSYYCLHNLGRFNKLEALTCQFGDDSKWRDVVQRITFPSSLAELSLRNCHLRWEDLTSLISSKALDCLRFLHLDSVRGHEWDLAEEEFSGLKILRINGCNDLVCWNACSSNFPVLESLHLWAVFGLSEIPFDFAEIQTLRLVELRGCTASAAVSAMRILVEQESFDNHGLQVYVHLWAMEEVVKFREMVEEEGLSSNALHLHYNDYRIEPF